MRRTYHTAEDMLGGFLQPMADGVFELLVPDDRTWNEGDEWGKRHSEILTTANRMDSTAGSTDFLVLLHSIDEQTNGFRSEVHIAIERQEIGILHLHENIVSSDQRENECLPVSVSCYPYYSAGCRSL